MWDCKTLCLLSDLLKLPIARQKLDWGKKTQAGYREGLEARDTWAVPSCSHHTGYQPWQTWQVPEPGTPIELTMSSSSISPWNTSARILRLSRKSLGSYEKRWFYSCLPFYLKLGTKLNFIEILMHGLTECFLLSHSWACPRTDRDTDSRASSTFCTHTLGCGGFHESLIEVPNFITS